MSLCPRDGSIHRRYALRRPIWMIPNSPNHGEEISTCMHQGCTVCCRNTANGDRGDFEQLLPPGKEFRCRVVRGVLAFGRKKGSEGHIIGAQLPRFHREMSGGVAGDAKDTPLQKLARFGVITIGLPQMGAITAQLDGQRSIVIQQKRDIPCRRHGHQHLRRAGNLIRPRVFQAQLKAGHISGIQGSCQKVTKGPRVEPGGRDQV